MILQAILLSVIIKYVLIIFDLSIEIIIYFININLRLLIFFFYYCLSSSFIVACFLLLLLLIFFFYCYLFSFFTVTHLLLLLLLIFFFYHCLSSSFIIACLLLLLLLVFFFYCCSSSSFIVACHIFSQACYYFLTQTIYLAAQSSDASQFQLELKWADHENKILMQSIHNTKHMQNKCVIRHVLINQSWVQDSHEKHTQHKAYTEWIYQIMCFNFNLS